MDVNPYESPQEPAAKPVRRKTREIIPRPLVRVGIGIFGGIFVAPALYVALVMMTQQHAVAEWLAIPEMVAGGIAVGWATFVSSPMMRIAAWACAGLGAGLILDAIRMGGLSVGTFVTPSGLILAVALSVIGYRAIPSR
jgi:hypothetical protein